MAKFRPIWPQWLSPTSGDPDCNSGSSFIRYGRIGRISMINSEANDLISFLPFLPFFIHTNSKTNLPKKKIVSAEFFSENVINFCRVFWAELQMHKIHRMPFTFELKITSKPSDSCDWFRAVDCAQLSLVKITQPFTEHSQGGNPIIR
jgi:hypothetical protein